MTAGIVLDASTTLAWAFDDEAGKYSEGVLQFIVGNHAVVPALWNYEIANGVLVGLRRERLSIEEAVTFVSDLAAMDIRVDSAQFEPVSLLAEAVDSGLTAYDASS
jgi:predicted nucleic acid-binding protein